MQTLGRRVSVGLTIITCLFLLFHWSQVIPSPPPRGGWPIPKPQGRAKVVVILSQDPKRQGPKALAGILRRLGWTVVEGTHRGVPLYPLADLLLVVGDTETKGDIGRLISNLLGEKGQPGHGPFAVTVLGIWRDQQEIVILGGFSDGDLRRLAEVLERPPSAAGGKGMVKYDFRFAASPPPTNYAESKDNKVGYSRPASWALEAHGTDIYGNAFSMMDGKDNADLALLTWENSGTSPLGRALKGKDLPHPWYPCIPPPGGACVTTLTTWPFFKGPNLSPSISWTMQSARIRDDQGQEHDVTLSLPQIDWGVLGQALLTWDDTADKPIDIQNILWDAVGGIVESYSLPSTPPPDAWYRIAHRLHVQVEPEEVGSADAIRALLAGLHQIGPFGPPPNNWPFYYLGSVVAFSVPDRVRNRRGDEFEFSYWETEVKGAAVRVPSPLVVVQMDEPKEVSVHYDPAKGPGPDLGFLDPFNPPYRASPDIQVDRDPKQPWSLRVQVTVHNFGTDSSPPSEVGLRLYEYRPWADGWRAPNKLVPKADLGSLALPSIPSRGEGVVTASFDLRKYGNPFFNMVMAVVDPGKKMQDGWRGNNEAVWLPPGLTP